MPNRTPAPRYLGDGVYASHDGDRYLVQTCDGYAVTNLIALTEAELDAFRDHRDRPDPEQPGRTLNDEVRAAHDGHAFRLSGQAADATASKIVLDRRTADALEEYRLYCAEYFGEAQDRVTPDCEECDASLEGSPSPVRHAVKGEIYKFHHQGRFREIRLCDECGTPLSRQRVEAILAKRNGQHLG